MPALAPPRRRPSHPAALPTLARRAIADERLFGRGDVVLCAVSGGPDSMALLHVLARLRPRLGHTLRAHGVDHGLRPEAAAELDVAAELARKLDVPFEVTRLSLSPGANVQARARDARLAALRAAAHRAGAQVLATGHHADDRAETLLLRLLRGAGPAGLAVLPPRDGDRVRPLIRARRAVIADYLARHRIAFARDPSNEDRRFARSRVRHELLPLLVELSPGVVGHLTALADALHAAGQEPARGLSRAHLAAVARALRDGQRGARILLPGGRVLRVDFPDGERVLK